MIKSIFTTHIGLILIDKNPVNSNNMISLIVDLIVLCNTKSQKITYTVTGEKLTIHMNIRI